MHYRLADQLCAVDGHTYRVNAVSHRVYLYLVLSNIIIIFTMLKFHCLRVPNLHMNLHPFTSYNAAFIHLEANLINIQISTKAHTAERCTLMLIRLSRSYLSYETDAFKMICLPLVNLSINLPYKNG